MQRSARLALMTMTGILGLAGCRPLPLYMQSPGGPPEYQLGWQDGCDSGVAAEGDMLQKMMVSFEKKPEFNSNALYKSGWNEGFMYCRFYTASWQK